MDAPLITLDDSVNTTDLYAFRSVSEDGHTQYLTTALSVYPFQEPGIGPNIYRFDEAAAYEIHILLGDGLETGRKALTYRFTFDTEFVNDQTILQAYLGEVTGVFDDTQNLRQTYDVTKFDRSGPKTARTVLARHLPVPPNNQGLLTRFYNQGDNGEAPAKEGVHREADLDVFTRGSIQELPDGERVFAGQRDDAFHADIQSIFDLDFSFGQGPGLAGTGKPFDSQGGFNVHTIVLNIPLDLLGDEKVAGVYATTLRRTTTVRFRRKDPRDLGRFVQVGRQGNPLFNEGFVPLAEKDNYNRRGPSTDARFFAEFAEAPELAAALGTTPIIDLVALYIPDIIKVDLTTPPARLPGKPGFHRLGIFGGDTLINGDGVEVPGGWPNGRRFGDDVVDIALLALGVPGAPDLGDTNFDGIPENDITFNTVFPYAATPHNGRNHPHH